MKVLIYGADGAGSLVGGFLARTGHAVSLLGEAAHLNVIKKDGLTITGIWGDYRIKAFDLYTEVSQIKNPDFDLIILSAESYASEKAVDEIFPLIQEKTVLFSLGEGAGNFDILLKKISSDRLLAGEAVLGLETSPGRVQVKSITKIAIQTPLGAAPKLSPERMAVILQNSKIPAKVVPAVSS